MFQRISGALGRTALVLGLVVGVVSACAPSGPPATGDHSGPVQADRSNYIVSLSRSDDAAASEQGAEQMRAELEADRDRVLAAVFGSETPPHGGSFVSIHAFEIRLTPEEAQHLMRHPDVVQVEADQTHRPTGAGAEG